MSGFQNLSKNLERSFFLIIFKLIEKFLEELRKQILQAREEYQKTIVPATEGDLSALDEAVKEHGAGSIIIP